MTDTTMSALPAQGAKAHDHTLLRVAQLVKRFGELTVVDKLDFAIAPGECLGIIGPNGAGKTTTIKACLGLIEADSGDIALLGHAMPRDAKLARARVGVVSQFDTLDPDFTVTENLVVFARYFGIRLTPDKIETLLGFADLLPKRDAHIKELSGGMRRRLSLARAMVNDPELLLLDEPTTGLDPQARHLMWERLKRLTRQGRAILLTTHFMEEAERLCHRVLVLDRGRLLADGSPRELIRRHVEPDVIELYGNDLDAACNEAAHLAARVERSGETAFLYTDNAQRLLEALRPFDDLTVMHRRVNLEDVFLKLTGRQLRD